MVMFCYPQNVLKAFKELQREYKIYDTKKKNLQNKWHFGIILTIWNNWSLFLQVNAYTLKSKIFWKVTKMSQKFHKKTQSIASTTRALTKSGKGTIKNLN